MRKAVIEFTVRAVCFCTIIDGYASKFPSTNFLEMHLAACWTDVP